MFLRDFNQAMINDKNGGEIKLLKDLSFLQRTSSSLEKIISSYEIISKFMPLKTVYERGEIVETKTGMIYVDSYS